MKKILITGVAGQDGSNLSEYLLGLEEKFEIYGLVKRSSNPNLQNIKHLINHPSFKLVSGDITDQTSMDNLVKTIQPDYLVNLAANSFVGTSWDTPDQVFNVNALGVLKCLEAIRKFQPKCRFYSAGSSEEFGEIKYTPQNESHPLIPVSPYAIAKVAARHIVDVYRRSYGLFAVHGTLYNHEGPRRGTEFVTRKVTYNIARILKELESNVTPKPFELGYIFAMKDWSDSRDMVRGIWMMLNQDKPNEYILASGKTRSIADFVDIGFKSFGFDGAWVIHENEPLKDYYYIYVNGKKLPIVTINQRLFRPVEVGVQLGDSSKIRQDLGWDPKITFDQMVREMVENDLRIIS